MGQEISWEIRENAEELYITGGRTYEEVAELTGVSVSQLKRWGSDGDWTERKREYRNALADIKRKTVLLKRDLLEKAMGSLDPQIVYAFSSIAKATKPESDSSGNTPAPAVRISDRHFETPGDALAALDEAIQHKINTLISVPGELDYKGIQDLKKSWDLVEQMKAKYNPEDKQTKNKGLSDAAADDIRRKILGIIE